VAVLKPERSIEVTQLPSRCAQQVLEPATVELRLMGGSLRGRPPRRSTEHKCYLLANCASDKLLRCK